MKYTVSNELTNNKELEFERSVWTGRTALKLNGRPFTKIGKNLFNISIDEEKSLDVFVKGNEITGLELQMKGKTVTLLRKLNIFEIILTFIPIYLVFIGGAIGGACCGLAIATNALLVRKVNNIFVKILLTLGIAALATVIWYVVVVSFFEPVEYIYY